MKTIHHVVDIDADPAVWTALTEQDRMAGWWSTQVEAADANVGTKVRWTFSGDFNPVMEITETDGSTTGLAVRHRPRALAGQHLPLPVHRARTTGARGCASGRTTRSNSRTTTTASTTSTGATTSRACRLFCLYGDRKPFPARAG